MAEVVDLPRQAVLVRVHKEPNTHGHVYACLDARRQLLVLSQRMRMIEALVSEATHERVNIASLYENASGKTRSHRSWRVQKLDRDELPSWLEAKRALYDRVAICTKSTQAWEVV